MPGGQLSGDEKSVTALPAAVAAAPAGIQIDNS